MEKSKNNNNNNNKSKKMTFAEEIKQSFDKYCPDEFHQKNELYNEVMEVITSRMQQYFYNRIDTIRITNKFRKPEIKMKAIVYRDEKTNPNFVRVLLYHEGQNMHIAFNKETMIEANTMLLDDRLDINLGLMFEDKDGKKVRFQKTTEGNDTNINMGDFVDEDE